MLLWIKNAPFVSDLRAVVPWSNLITLKRENPNYSITTENLTNSRLVYFNRLFLYICMYYILYILYIDMYIYVIIYY